MAILQADAWALMRAKKVLMCSYGGGHSKVLIPVARALLAKGYALDLIGFTTAYREFERAGLPVRSVESLIDPVADAAYLKLAGQLSPPTDHPDITAAQTLAYTALGLRDLVLKLGEDEAVSVFAEKGRFAFEPIDAAGRAIRAAVPDIVVATTSPRMELAFLRAARELGVPALAIANQFIIDERAWVLSGQYADNLATLSTEVADSLRGEGLPPSEIRVTGNPAFDALAGFRDNLGLRSELRRRLGLKDETVLLWPLNNAKAARTGEAFVGTDTLVSVFEATCRTHPGTRYILRRHPNGPMTPPAGMEFGLFDDGSMTTGECLLVADKVCGEMSTVLLEGILLGKPAACYGFADYVPYIRWGLAEELKTLDDIATFAQAAHPRERKTIGIPPLGSATGNVVTFIEDILGQAAVAPVRPL